nr:NlpC/P60 family protein [uncultured Oribacterium sp.]
MGRICILLLLFPAFFLALYQKPKKNPERTVEKHAKAAISLSPSSLYFQKEEETAVDLPKIDRYNLYYVRDDAGNSIGEQFYKEMMQVESSYLARISEEAGETPEKVAKTLGVKRSRIMGKYNPSVQNASENRAAAYPVPYFKNIHYRFINGDGQEITDSSNVKDILAMASVYSYKHNYLDVVHFQEVCKELFEKSHSYHLSIGPVYYDEGCMDFNTGEDLHEEEAGQPETVKSEAEQKASSPESSVAAQKNSPEETKVASGETEKNVVPSEAEKKEKSTVSASDLAESGTEEQPVLKEKKTETGGQEEKNDKKKKTKKSYCPGHVDLTITIQVKKFHDQNGLREIPLSSLEKDQEQDRSPFSRWKGWNAECIAAVNQLAERDWFSAYGLSLSTVETKTPITEEEISHYMSLLSENLSEERKNVIHFALTTVGKVPYYYGGKAGKQGLTGNGFGKTIAERDYKGRNRKGLDCSGFAQWVYWTGAENPLDFASSTQELIGKGRKIKRSELKPGDLVIQPGGESHVVLFLTWTKEGKMLAIHENATAGNVSVDEVYANYPYYRSILP